MKNTTMTTVTPVTLTPVTLTPTALTVGDRTFRRTPTKAFWGDISPEEILLVEEALSDKETACHVRPQRQGDGAGALVPGFELHWFDM